MDDWDNFYMLAGSTGGTLIGLIFVVITLGIEHAGGVASMSRPSWSISPPCWSLQW